ncbi:hypothetical protein CR513_17360, partial [Mucuna pruriens]
MKKERKDPLERNPTNSSKSSAKLKHTSANISPLSLLMNSESHKKLLMKVLSEAHMAQDITLDKLKGIIGNIMVNNYLTFSNNEIPVEGRSHNRALHIFVKCLDHMLTRVLIDNGSSLNDIPKTTLERLPYDQTHMRASFTIVRAFDDSRREVMRDIKISADIQLSIGQTLDPFSQSDSLLFTSEVEIHSGRQAGEEDILVCCPRLARYIEAVEEALETSFQSLEIISTTYVETRPKKGKPTNAMMTAAKIMVKKGYRPGQGLGKNLDDIAQPIQLKKNLGPYGLGFCPNFLDKRIVGRLQMGSRKATGGLYENFINREYTNQVEEATKADEEGIDQEPLEELKRLVHLEDKIIQPYQERVEVIDKGTKRI